MGHFYGFLLTNEPAKWISTIPSAWSQTNYDPSAERLGYMMAWFDDVAINNNILAGSKFTWKRCLDGTVTTFTPSLTYPHGLEGTLLVPEVVNQVKTNLQTIASHFGWDFSTYPPANMYGQSFYHDGAGDYTSLFYSCPGFPGSFLAADFDKVEHEWPPSTILNFGYPVRHYFDYHFPQDGIANDYFEGYPYLYGPLNTANASRSSTKNHIPNIASGELYKYNVRFGNSSSGIFGTYHDSTSSDFVAGYVNDIMVSMINSVWASFSTASPVVTEGTGSSGYNFEADAYLITGIGPAYYRYRAHMSWGCDIDLYYIRGKNIKDLFGATTSQSANTGYYYVVADNLYGYFTLDNNGYSVANAATRLSIVQNVVNTILASPGSWLGKGATLSNMVQATGNLLVNIGAGIPLPLTNPIPLPTLSDGDYPSGLIWSYKETGSGGAIETITPHKTRHYNINPHLFASGILEEEAPPPP